MVNCGGIGGSSESENLSNDEAWLLNSAIKALSKAFPGQVSFVFWFFITSCITLLYHVLRR
jgi:hypothetical protein